MDRRKLSKMPERGAPAETTVWTRGAPSHGGSSSQTYESEGGDLFLGPNTPATNAVVDIGEGEIIDGKYRIEATLGEGTFARVYRARHTQIPTLECAVKVLRSEHAEDPGVRARFRQEAQTIAALRDPHTVRVLDFGETDWHALFMVLELVRGQPLDVFLAERGPLPEELVGSLVCDVLSALDEAHALGIVHRDLKPSNIIIVPSRGERAHVARVLDFGIAKLLAGSDDHLDAIVRTVHGAIHCTPLYAAPELLFGEPGPQSDLYSLGHVMAEMLDGHTPYSGTSLVTVISQHLSLEPVALGVRSSRSALAAVVARACAKSVDDRYRSASEMASAVGVALATARSGRIDEPSDASPDCSDVTSVYPAVSAPLVPRSATTMDPSRSGQVTRLLAGGWARARSPRSHLLALAALVVAVFAIVAALLWSARGEL